MQITRQIINTEPPEKDAIYLALKSPEQYCDSNLYMPTWDVVDSTILSHINQWVGWVRIDRMPKQHFEKGEPPYREHYDIYSDGSKTDTGVNCVLALYKNNYRECNCFHPYGIANTAYYKTHMDEFDGWIDLEDVTIHVTAGRTGMFCDDKESKILDIIFGKI